MASVSTNVEVEAIDVEPKKCLVTDRLQKRDEERLLQIQQRKTIRDEAGVSRETVQYFTEQFAQLSSEIESSLNDYSVEVHGPAGEHFNGLQLQVQKLQKYLSDSTHFLSAYEVKKAQATVNKLKQALEQKKDEVVPKKKFAFKSEKKKISNVAAVSKVPSRVDSVDNTIKRENNECGFVNRTDEALNMPRREIDGKDVVLSSLRGCRVMLHGTPSTVHLNAITDCVLLCGPTSGSVFIDDCVNCTFVVACHQLRVHRTTNSSFYLYVSSRGIIEDCSSVSFAPYSWQYSTLEEDFKQIGFDIERNNWNCIDDFNWLASNAASPNWSVMDTNDRVTFSDDGSANATV